MKIVFREQGIEMHILAPVGESPPLRGVGGVAGRRVRQRP